MTKDVLVTVTGFQFAEGEQGGEPIELVTPGKYYFHENNHYLIYEESMEGFEEATQNFMKFTNERVELRKKGLINVNMLFEPGKKTVAPYQTPLGTLEMGITATGIRLLEEKDGLDLTIDYALSLDEQTMVDCTVHVGMVSQL